MSWGYGAGTVCVCVCVCMYVYHGDVAVRLFISTDVRRKQSNPTTGLVRPWGFQEVKAPRFQDNWHSNVVSMSALRTSHLYPPGNNPGSQFCSRLNQPQSHSAVRRIMPMKNSNDTIGNRTRDLPACSPVPQPTAPLCIRADVFKKT